MASFTVRPIEVHEHDTWDEFVALSPQGTLFHTSTWKKVIDRAYAPAHYLLLGCFDDHNLVGGCVVLDRTRLRQRTAVTPLMTPYTGFLHEQAIGEKLSDQVTQQHEVLTELIRWLAQNFVYQSFINPPHFEDTRPLQVAGYHLVPRFTYHLNVKLPAEELWERLDGSVRRQIRKAERDNFEISDLFDPDAAYQIYRETFERRNERCPIKRELFDAIAESDPLRDNRQFFSAHRDGRLVSFIVLLLHQRSLYYAIAATAEDLLPSGISSLLIWNVIKAFACQEWNVLDFVGANMPSIARFKERFNPKLVLHFQSELTSHYMRIGRKIAKILRH